MRLPPGSRALRRRRSGLPHPVLRRAPQDGSVGLRNPSARDPVRERGDKVFGERSHATTGFSSNTDDDDFFPNDDFFPDVDDLLCNNMSSSANATASSSAPYVFLVYLFDMMLHVLLLTIYLDLHVLLFPVYLDLFTMMNHMSTLFPLLFLRIKSFRKLLIY